MKGTKNQVSYSVIKRVPTGLTLSLAFRVPFALPTQPRPFLLPRALLPMCQPPVACAAALGVGLSPQALGLACSLGTRARPRPVAPWSWQPPELYW